MARTAEVAGIPEVVGEAGEFEMAGVCGRAVVAETACVSVSVLVVENAE